MDVVGALSKYRKSIISDETAFDVLHLIDKDGLKKEKDIEKETDIARHILKKALRELHQANLLRIEAQGYLTFTSFAESVLSNLGADIIVVPFF